jgi:hypothetical protein
MVLGYSTAGSATSLNGKASNTATIAMFVSTEWVSSVQPSPELILLDHHCPWTGKCVAERNMKPFIAFVSTTVFLLFYLLFSVGYLLN